MFCDELENNLKRVFTPRNLVVKELRALLTKNKFKESDKKTTLVLAFPDYAFTVKVHLLVRVIVEIYYEDKGVYKGLVGYNDSDAEGILRGIQAVVKKGFKKTILEDYQDA